MRARWVAVGLLASLGGSAPALAFECKTPDDRPQLSLRWPARTLDFGVRANSGLDPDLVREAFDVWSAPACSDLEFRYVGLVAEADPVNQVLVVAGGWEAGGRPWEAVAVTETSFFPDSGLIDRAVIEVNEEMYAFGDAEVSCAGGVYDRAAVLTHEVGHFLGLGHTNRFSGAAGDPTMAPRVAECEVDKRTLEEDDVQGLCFLYPAGGPTGRCGGLPDQPGYVSNTPFGCRTAPSAGDAAGAAVILLMLARRREKTFQR